MAPRRTRRAPEFSTRFKIVFGVVAVLLFAAGIYFGLQIARPPERPDLDTALGEPEPPSGETETAPGEPAEEQLPEPGPRAALVVDDLGRSLEEVAALEKLGVPITYSVLPYETLTSEVVEDLHRRGAEVLCHLPMAAKNGANPGPGALSAEMAPAELRALTRRALAAVDGAVGVNNHMGSGFMPDERATRIVLEVIAGEGLFFIDSRTSADTKGFEVARRLGMPALERQVFLDTERDREFIRGQFAELVRRVEAGENVVAIAHPYPETVEVLAAELPRARSRGVEFVKVSELFGT